MVWLMVPVTPATCEDCEVAEGAAGAAAVAGPAMPQSMAPERATAVIEAETLVRIFG
jgi:hypothetical protein